MWGGKTRQDKTRGEKRVQDNTGHSGQDTVDETGQDKARHDKTVKHKK